LRSPSRSHGAVQHWICWCYIWHYLKLSCKCSLYFITSNKTLRIAANVM
jgi:hypothetical protein